MLHKWYKMLVSIFNASLQTDRYKQRRGGMYSWWWAMLSYLISPQCPRWGCRASPAPHTRGSEPARPPPGPPRPARTAAAAARTAFLFSVTFLGTGFTFSLLTTPCGSAGDLLVLGTVRCVHHTQNINSEFRDFSPFILPRPAHSVREEAFSDVDIWWWKK